MLIRASAIAAGALAILLAQVGAASAPTPVTPAAPGKDVRWPAGRAPVIAMQSTRRPVPPSPELMPVHPMNGSTLALAKARAAARHPLAHRTTPGVTSSTPAAVGAHPAAAIFNNLDQPGISASDEGNGVTPPDTTGAIGPNFYLEFVNQTVGVFDRTTLARISTLDLASFAGVPSGVTPTDVQIQWDPQSNRWIYALIGFATGNNYVIFGWTKTNDPSSLPGGWCRYGVGTGSSLNDYPKLGHDANFITIGSNIYSDATPSLPFVTANIWAIPKPAAGDTTCSSPVTAYYFADATHLLYNADGSLAFTPVPANTQDATSTGYIVAAHDDTNAAQSKVMVWHVVPGPVLMADGDLTVGSFSVPPPIPQPGSTATLDSLDGRLTQAVQLNNAAGSPTVWTQHTVAGATGLAVDRWYQFAPATMSVLQEGTVASSTDDVFNGAISPSFAGGAVVEYSRGSGATYALIGAQSRQGGTPAGQMDAGEVVLASSSTADAETAFQGNCAPVCRWGDYSGASPDPNNANVVYGSNQLIGGGVFGLAQWTTQNFAISAGPSVAPDFALSVAPASQTVAQGNGTSYTVTVTPSGGFSSGVTLSVSGLPAGSSGTFGTNPTTSTSTLSVSTGNTTPAGTYTLTVQGTSGTLSHTATATLAVNPPPDFAIGASPASVSVGGSVTSATYTVTITPQNGFTGQVALTASGPLIGALGTFNPNPATSTSTLTVSIIAKTPAGSYPLTVTGTSGNLSHSTSMTLVVKADFAMSASPTSRTVTRGRTTTFALTITDLNGFTGAVTLSATGLPSGAGATFSTNPATSSSTLTVTTAGSTPTGTYTLSIRGTNGSLAHTITVKLVVN